MSVVSIQTGENVYDATEKALESLDFSIDNNRSVLVKPNLTTNDPPESGITTHPDSVKAILEKINLKNVTIGEGSGGSSASKAFKDQGYSKLAREFNTNLVDFDDDKIIRKEIENPFYRKEIPIAKAALDSDYIISAAKLKTHSVAKVTLSMKNMFGAVPLRRNKLKFHRKINRAIPDFMKVVKPDFAVIEGFPGNEGDEVISNPVDSNIVIAGRDPLEVDIIGSLCMMVDPEDVEHIQLVKQMEGNENPQIEIVGKNVERVVKEYKTNQKLKAKIRNRVEKMISYLGPS